MPNDKRLQISLYMGNLQISYRHPKWKVVERKFPDSVNVVEKFDWNNVFKLSTSKTSMFHFTQLSFWPPIELRLGNIGIKKSETLKYLALVFNSKFDW